MYTKLVIRIRTIFKNWIVEKAAAATAFNNGNQKWDSQSKKRSRKMIEGRANGKRKPLVSDHFGTWTVKICACTHTHTHILCITKIYRPKLVISIGVLVVYLYFFSWKSHQNELINTLYIAIKILRMQNEKCVKLNGQNERAGQTGRPREQKRKNSIKHRLSNT